MINNITFFESAEDLEKLTGLSHEELWDNGFDLDDMDCGFCYDVKEIPIADVEEKEHFMSDTYKWTKWEFINDTYEFP